MESRIVGTHANLGISGCDELHGSGVCMPGEKPSSSFCSKYDGERDVLAFRVRPEISSDKQTCRHGDHARANVNALHSGSQGFLWVPR